MPPILEASHQPDRRTLPLTYLEGTQVHSGPVGFGGSNALRGPQVLSCFALTQMYPSDETGLLTD
jgi:hypothetical protein